MLVFLFSTALYAQNTGSLGGNVQDPGGRVVPNALIVVKAPATGSSLTVHSNEHGEYIFPTLAIGVYTLSVKAPGFAEYSHTDITVDAGQSTRVDAHLQLRSVDVQVTVESGSAVVDTQSGTVGTVISQDLIDNLPIDGNNVVALTAILPGVVDVNAPTTFTQPDSGPTYSSSGSRPNQNLMLLDGFMWNNVFYNTGLTFPPPPALQEVSVLQNNFKAEYGRNAGSVFNVLTRSGTNSFHGTLWEYLQNRAFNASDYISHVNPKLVQNQFGATLGGPILKNRLHFFVSYQDLRAAQQDTAQNQTLSPNERGFSDQSGTPLPCDPTGGFPGMTCASFREDVPAGTSVDSFLTNPLYRALAVSTSQLNATYQQAGGTGTSPCVTLLTSTMAKYGHYMPRAEVPSICFNPVAVNILQKYVPYPNLANHLTVSTAALPQNDQNVLGRIDWNLGRHSIDARYNYQGANDTRANAVAGGTGTASYEIDRNTAALNFGSFGDTWVLTPRLLNTFRAGYKRFEYFVLPTDPTTASDLGINIKLPMVPSLPTISVYNRFSLGSNSSAWLHTVSENIEIDDAMSWTHGSHNIKFGVSWLRLQYLSQNDSPASFTFFNQAYGYPAAEFMSGLLNQLNVANRSTIASTSPNFYTYAQDDWRATRKLTLNFGVRYELPFMWTQPKGQAALFVPGYQSKVFPGAPVDLAYVGDSGVLKSLVPTPKTGVAPRLGFAYDVFGNGRTVLRGGGGLFFDAINANVVGISTPFHYAALYTQPAGGLSQPLLGLPQVPDNSAPVTAQNAQFVAPFAIAYPDRNFTTPYTEAGNLGFSQRIKKGYIAVDYLLKLGRHQLIPIDQNPAIYDCSGAYFQVNPTLYCTSASTSASSYTNRVKYPGFNYGGQGVVDFTTVGVSNYNALQVAIGSRGGKHLSMQGSYTFARSLDESSNGQTISAHVPNVLGPLRNEYGLSNFQSKHIFNIGWVLKGPRFKTGNALWRVPLNGWQFSGTYGARTGHPFSVLTSNDTSLTKESSQRAFLVPGASVKLPSDRHRVDKVKQWFNTAAFCGGPQAECPGVKTGDFSTQGRNTVIGPAFITTNFGAGRSFFIPYRHSQLQFRADAFNVFNTPNLGNPNATYSSTSGLYGTITATAGSNSTVNTNGRRVQLSLVLKY